MSANIQDLIEQIKSEGVDAAEKKAGEIKSQANSDAAQIIEAAKQEAAQIIKNAEEEVKKLEASTEATLKQVSRDFLIALKKDILSNLNQLVAKEVKGSLSSEQLSGILEKVISKAVEQGGEAPAIDVVLSADDLKALESGFTSKLQQKVKGSFQLKSSDGVSGGFLIGYDQGKSNFDFSEKSLAEYLSQYVNDYVSNLLTTAV